MNGEASTAEFDGITHGLQSAMPSTLVDRIGQQAKEEHDRPVIGSHLPERVQRAADGDLSGYGDDTIGRVHQDIYGESVALPEPPRESRGTDMSTLGDSAIARDVMNEGGE